MPLLSKKDSDFLREHLAHALTGPVKLLYFTQTVACQFCKETEQVLRELAELSSKITLEVYNFVNDQAVVEQYGIERIPATVVLGAKDYGIRFYGIPSGYEFTSLVEDVIDVSQGKTALSAETLQQIEAIQTPVHIQVYVTPTCPYCPAAVRLAHSLAIASDLVRADMVESVEFPELTGKYHVHGVPQTVINEDVRLEGAASEKLFIAKVLQGAGLMTAQQVDEVMHKLEQAAPKS